MSNKKFLFLSFLLTGLLFGFGCQSTQQAVSNNSSQVAEEESLVAESGGDLYLAPIESLEKTVYTAFIINTHDWVNTEESIDTLNKIIDLHEAYQMPVDIYLDDPVIQVFVSQAPDLIERLKTSQYVAVSYHLRPPYPYYWSYDWLGFDKMTNQKIEDTLRDYEEHSIDLTTGQPTDNPGGYQYLKELMGYSPYVAVVMGSPKVAPILADIYKEMGAKFNLTHSGNTAWGETEYGLYMRPEDLEVKVYETKKRLACEDLLDKSLAELTTSRPAFMNLKWHEDNFYTSETPWGSVYWTNEKDRGTLSPPYDLSKAMVGVTVKTETQKAEQWTRYEECLVYVKEHPEIFTAINAKELLNMFEGK